MASITNELIGAFVAAYRPYLEERLSENRQDEPPGFDEAVEAGAAWLKETLADLLGSPFLSQRRGPLEVFQEAVRFVGDALAAAGVEPATRNDILAAVLPGDIFNLAPASSRLLGEAAWQAHLAWGALKARAMAPAVDRSDVVGLVSGNLMDRARIESLANRHGLRLVTWRDGRTARAESLETEPRVVFVDLSAPDAGASIDSFVAAGVSVVAFGPHVDDAALEEARQLGAEPVLPRSRFFKVLPDLFV